MMQLEKIIMTSVIKSDHVTLNNMRFDVNNHDYWPWLSRGLWEHGPASFYKDNIRNNSEVIDFGAYFGGTALLAYALGAKKVSCIEADPSNFNILANNIAQNNLNGKIIAHNLAVYKNTGETLHFGYRDELHKIDSAKTFTDNGAPVKTVKMIDFLKVKDLRETSVIKIDIQGAEQYIGDALEYIANSNMDIKVYLAMHAPFFKNKQKVSENLLLYLKLFNIKNLSNKNITIDQLRRDLCAEYKCEWPGMTGKFFDIVLSTR